MIFLQYNSNFQYNCIIPGVLFPCISFELSLPPNYNPGTFYGLEGYLMEFPLLVGNEFIFSDSHSYYIRSQVVPLSCFWLEIIFLFFSPTDSFYFYRQQFLLTIFQWWDTCHKKKHHIILQFSFMNISSSHILNQYHNNIDAMH